MVFLAYLISGTGNACAWHNNAKLACMYCKKMLPLEEDENVGALAPTGSV